MQYKHYGDCFKQHNVIFHMQMVTALLSYSWTENKNIKSTESTEKASQIMRNILKY